MTDFVRREAEFLLYQNDDGRTRIEVRYDGETEWLWLGQMAELFQRDKSVISRDMANVFEQGGLFHDLKMKERIGEGGLLLKMGGVA